MSRSRTLSRQAQRRKKLWRAFQAICRQPFESAIAGAFVRLDCLDKLPKLSCFDELIRFNVAHAMANYPVYLMCVCYEPP